MLISLWVLTGIVCFLIIEMRALLDCEIEDLSMLDYAGSVAFAIGGYIVAWPYCLFNVVMGEEVDESKED